tara:strand:+ start:224 stop:1081 length:858 start_codon:yes stop_codon:yes gene_type:complete
METPEKPAVKRGRPVARKETTAPTTSPKKKAVSKTGSVIKRNIPNEEKMPKLYETLGNRGGVYFKLKGNNLVVFDEETNSNRQIRYCPGEPSIYVDEQSKSAVREHVIFRNKMLVVRYDQPNLREFLTKHPENTSNGGGLFKLVNKEVDVEKQIENDFLVTDAITLIKARPVDELLPVAMALNINTNQKDLNLKRDLVNYAKNKPQEFLDMFDNPMVHARTTVMQGLDFQIVTEKNGVIVWPDTGKIVLSVPVGQDPVDTLTRFCMTDKGSSVLSEIERQLSDIA